MQTLHKAIGIFGVLCLLLVFAVAANADLIVYETFGGASTPDGWTIQGDNRQKIGLTWTTSDKTDVDFFANSQGYLALTKGAPSTTPRVNEYTGAYYTDQLVSSRNWTIEAEVNIYGPSNNSGGGLAFAFVDARTIDSFADLQGEIGFEKTGLPDIDGYAFQFAHGPAISHFDRLLLVELNPYCPWGTDGNVSQSPTQYDFSEDAGGYFGKGWLGVKLENDGDKFTFSWKDPLETSYNPDNSYSFTCPEFPTYDAYFGITGSNSSNATHQVRNFELDSGCNNAVPEPATLALMASGLVGLYLRRRKSA